MGAKYDLRARRFRQENVVKQTRVGVSARYICDLKIEQGIYNHDPYFEDSEELVQINKNPELFGSFSSFFRSNNVLRSSHGNVIYLSPLFSDRNLIDRPRDQQSFDESRSVIGDVDTVPGSRA